MTFCSQVTTQFESIDKHRGNYWHGFSLSAELLVLLKTFSLHKIITIPSVVDLRLLKLINYSCTDDPDDPDDCFNSVRCMDLDTQ